jgi:hypothetical protein
MLILAQTGVSKVKMLFLFLFILYILRPLYYNMYMWWESKPHFGDNECKSGLPNDPDKIWPPKPRVSGTVKIISLTDSGEFADRCELTAALTEIVRYRNESDDVGKKLIVLYVHGWRNDSRINEGDFVYFGKLIESLKRRFAGEKHVVGIYVSWKARNENFVLSYLNFWSRMFAADRIAQSGTVASIVGAISNISRVDNHDSEFVAIGHSFGARILFSSVQQNFLYALERAHPAIRGGTYQILRPIADGIILLNPAFEVSIYARLDAKRRYQEKFDSLQTPLLVTISGNSDYATRFAFPAGQWVAGWLPRLDLITVGNYKPFRTHKLVKTDFCDSVRNYISIDGGFSTEKFCMKSTQDSPFPFHMVTADSSVISGHSDIWNSDFSEYIFELTKEMATKARSQSLEPK